MTPEKQSLRTRQQRFRKKRAKAGMVRKDIWTFPHLWEKVKAAVAKINDGN